MSTEIVNKEREKKDQKDTTNPNKRPGVGQSPNNKMQKKRKKEFDMSKYHKRHIALKVAYIGWNYHGFASQADNINTIEGHLFDALQKTCLITSRDESHYTRCGRTDKGVSAFGQVIALHLRSNLTQGLGIIEPESTESTSNRNTTSCNTEQNTNETNNNNNQHKNTSNNQNRNNDSNKNNKNKENKAEIDYALILNRVLPPEIRVINWAPVPLHFNARFSALYRTYKYFFVPEGLDIEAMKTAAKSFVGEHDFRNFCKMDVENVKNFTRVILSINVDPGVITISGFAFLWHQVRCMVAVLFMVGKHLESPQIVETLLDTQRVPAKPIYDMASEIPLVLFDCGFEDLHWNKNENGEGTSEEVQRKLVSHFETISHEHYLKSKVAGLMLEATRTSCTSLPKEQYPKRMIASSLRSLTLTSFTTGHVSLLQRGTEESLEMRLKKQQAKQTPKMFKRDDD